MSDDISMGALVRLDRRARSRAAIAAGCDLVLHCNGKLDEMQQLRRPYPLLAGEAAAQRGCRAAHGAAACAAAICRTRCGPNGRRSSARTPARRPEGDIMTADESNSKPT